MENIIERAVMNNFSEDFNDSEDDDRDINDIQIFQRILMDILMIACSTLKKEACACVMPL